MGYIKQNVGAEVTWRPVNSVNVGAAYGFERYDWTRADASSTTENSGKVYADWKPTSWITARASALFAERRAGNYDYLGNVGIFQWPVPRSRRRSDRVSERDPVLAVLSAILSR